MFSNPSTDSSNSLLPQATKTTLCDLARPPLPDAQSQESSPSNQATDPKGPTGALATFTGVSKPSRTFLGFQVQFDRRL
jgi:hypothetical protein